MTYAVGQIIRASDDFAGPIASNQPYPSSSAATSKVAALIGVGYGDRGYGQGNITLITPVSTGIVITASHANSVINALTSINTHQGNANVIPSTVSVGSIIDAYDGSSSRPNLLLTVPALDSNRFTFSISQMLLSSVLTGTRTDPWGVSVFHEFTATFPDEDHARYFFNSGSQIYLAASRTGGSSTEINETITDMLNAMGTVKVAANATTYTGTGGVPVAKGFWQLTGTYQVLFTAFGTDFGYTNASYTVQARVENVLGVNGGNGSVVRIQAIFATGLPGSDGVDGTLVSAISQLIAFGAITVNAPTYSPGAPYNNNTF